LIPFVSINKNKALFIPGLQSTDEGNKKRLIFFIPVSGINLHIPALAKI
jgi:hypothetical protein